MGFIDSLEIDGKKLQFLVAEPLSDKLKKAIEKLRTMGAEGGSIAQIILCPTPQEASQIAQKLPGCISLYHLNTQTELVASINSLKICRGSIDQGRARIVFMFAGKAPDDFILAKLRNVGVGEFITEPVNDRALVLKLERLVKAHPRYKELQKLSGGDSKGKGGSASGGKKEGGSVGTASSSEIKKAPPLPIKSDFWLAAQGGARKVGPRWVLRIAGPSPAAGKWVQLETDSKGGGSWKFEIQEKENDPFYQEPGEWIFRGSRVPNFSENLWWLTGSKFSLEFVRPNQPVLSKIRVEDSGALILANDSLNSAQIEAWIAQSFEKKLKQKKGSQEEEATSSLLKAKTGSSEDEGTGEDFKGENTFGFDKPTASSPFRLVPPLELASDFWTFEEDGRLKKIGQRWSIRIVGPSRRTGRWTDVSAKGSKLLVWKWEPERTDEFPFVVDEGAWYFVGDQPIIQESRWVFVSDQPQLYFRKKGEEQKLFRLRLAEDGKVDVARDSKASKKHRPLVEKSFEMENKTGADAELSPELEATQEGVEGTELSGKFKNKNAEGSDASATQEGIEGTELQGTFKKKKNSGSSDLSLDSEEETDEAKEESGSDIELEAGSKKKKKRSSDETAQKADDASTSSESVEDETTEESSTEEEEAGSSPKKKSGSDIDLQGKLNLDSVEKKSKKAKDSSSGATEDEKSAELEAVEAKEKKKAKSGDTETQGKAKGVDAAAESQAETAAPAESGEFQGLFADPEAQKKSSEPDFKKLGEEDIDVELDPTRAVELKEKREKLAELESEKAADEEVKKKKPATAGPHVSPLAALFYMSELMLISEQDEKIAGEKFCRYLSRSCGGGRRFEIWVKAPRWSPVAGTFADRFVEASVIQEAAQTEEAQPIRRGETVMVPVPDKKGEWLGMLVWVSPQNEVLTDDYLKSLSRALMGVLLGARQKIQEDPASAAA